MQNTEQQDLDWRTEIREPTPILKIADGETAEFEFQNEGKKISGEYGEEIKFSVLVDGKEMDYYVRANSFSLLNQIKNLGALTGIKVKVSRTGSKKNDTRYTIVKVSD